MLLEDQRFLHEDLERLESAISDRLQDEPRNIRDQLTRDHEISEFLTRIQDQSSRLITLYKDAEGARAREVQAIGTGDSFEEFYKQLSEVKSFHRRYPNEPVENLEKAYSRKRPHQMISGDDGEEPVPVLTEVDKMFSGEEAYGRYFDLTSMHEQYVNLPGARHINYMQYLDSFDSFTAIRRADKLKDEYLRYVGELASYLESFMRRTKPLEDLDKVFSGFDKEFDEEWDADKVPGWSTQTTGAASADAPVTEGSGEGVWCADCQKEFKNDNVYKAHLTGKKHIKNAEARQGAGTQASGGNGQDSKSDSMSRLKERAVAKREHRVRRLAASMQTERSDTRVNVERRQGMTERERQQEMEALFAESQQPTGQGGDNADSDDEEKVHNPLNFPLAYDGKPIPFWLWKLHGLGVEFPCEICGNYVHMGRRAFDKHFNEARHIYGLKCLGITATNMFREITSIDDALKLWAKLEQDKKKQKAGTENVVQMEDSEGNVMPEKVYYDLQKQGLV